MAPTPIEESFLTKLTKALMPQLLKYAFESFVKNVGGFKFWVLKKLFQWGGKELIEYINQVMRDHDQKVAQETAKKILEEIRNNPNSTKEDIGKAYEDYYNSGHGPKPDSSAERAVLNKL